MHIIVYVEPFYVFLQINAGCDILAMGESVVQRRGELHEPKWLESDPNGDVSAELRRRHGRRRGDRVDSEPPR